MGPGAVGELRLHHTVTSAFGLDDHTFSNVDADVTFMPNSQSRNFRDGIDASFLGGIVIHLVSIDVRHPIGCVVDLKGIRIQPAVAFDEANAVSGSSTKPVTLNEVCISAHFLRVLLKLCVVQIVIQYLSKGSPDISPAVSLRGLCPLH